MKTHTPFRVEGPQSADCGSETVCSGRYHLSLKLGRQLAGAGTRITPVLKTGVLLARPPARSLATWALRVVPSGIPLSGPDMSGDMRLWAISCAMARADESELLAVSLSVPVGGCGTEIAASSTVAVMAAYVAPPLGARGTGRQWRLVRPWLAGNIQAVPQGRHSVPVFLQQALNTRPSRQFRLPPTPSQLCFTPSQAKVLTEGGDLREGLVDVTLSGSHSCD